MLEVFNTARAFAGCFGSGPMRAEDFACLIAGEETYVVLTMNQIAAFVSVWPPDRFIHHLYVAPLNQNRGVGSSLLRMCAKKYGLPLSLKCDIANLRTRAFYERRGWVPGESGSGPDGPWQRLWLKSE